MAALNVNELLYLIHQKDEEALHLLYQHLQRYICFVYYRKCSSLLSLEEWEGDALEVLVHCVDRFQEHNDASFETFYVTTLKRRAIYWMRKANQKTRNLPGMGLSLDGLELKEDGHTSDAHLRDLSCPGVEEQAITSVTCSQILCQLKGHLNEKELKVLQMCREGYNLSDIARILEIPVSEIRRVKKKARIAYSQLSAQWA